MDLYTGKISHRNLKDRYVTREIAFGSMDAKYWPRPDKRKAAKKR
jgi:hypothetical protein